MLTTRGVHPGVSSVLYVIRCELSRMHGFAPNGRHVRRTANNILYKNIGSILHNFIRRSLFVWSYARPKAIVLCIYQLYKTFITLLLIYLLYKIITVV